MIKYVLYLKQGKMPFIRTGDVIKTDKPLTTGRIFSYHQLGISKATIKKCSFTSNEYRVYVEK